MPSLSRPTYGGVALQRIRVRQRARACAGDDEFVWTFEGLGADASGRFWETCVLVLGGPEQDLLTVRTAYADTNAAPPFRAQPKFLCPLIEHLPFEDGSYPIVTQARQVFSVAAFDKFREHLLDPRRSLPILAVSAMRRPTCLGPRRPARRSWRVRSAAWPTW